ncbi:hypothetical protein [Prevotella vespertina]|nr:hypothetical protein [Prevotella vespertina]
MKKLLTLSIALSLATNMMAAEPNSDGLEKDKAVYLELLGASNMVGINYDQRFNDHTKWGWRAGVSFAFGNNSNFFGNDGSIRYYSVPLEVNYLLGSQKNNLEVGAGANVGIYNSHDRDIQTLEGPVTLTPDQQAHLITQKTINGKTITFLGYNTSHNRFGYYFFGNIGYRHVSNKGFLFRVGVNPSFTLGEKNAIKKAVLYPYLGFGWAF